MIKIKNISKQYAQNTVPAVNEVSLTIETGETVVFLGSSGSGKTTLLKMINRLITPSSGSIEIEGKNITAYSLQDLRLNMGYVFQQVGLFPHMTIAKNIAIVLRLLKKSRTQRLQRSYELLELVGLDPNQYASRFPDELSGGQQQRVGVARALAADPDYLLMDEPFGSLDALTRNALQDEVLRLNNMLHKTIVFVTHDIHEAFRLADRIAVMHKGRLEQVGTKEDLMQRPATPFVQEFIAQSTQTLQEL